MTFTPVLPLFVLYILLAAAMTALVLCLIKRPLRKANNLRRLAILALIFVAMLRPSISGGSAERDLSNLNIFFVVDNTGSMAAKDMNNASEYRYEVMTDDMKKIVELFPGSKYAIIALDYNIYQAMPLIEDANTALAYISSLSPRESTASTDSDLSHLLAEASTRIEQYSARYKDRDNLLFFFSDGENANNTTISTPNELKQNIVGGAVIGYGTTNGARVGTISTDYETKSLLISDSVFIKDHATGMEHISRLDETNLKSVADKIGIEYYRRSSSGDIFGDINSFVTESAIYHRSDDMANINSDLYWLFVIIAMALLLWDFYSILEALSLERKVAK